MSAVPPPAREPCPGCSRISTRHRRLSGRPHLARRRSDVPKSPPLNPGRRLTPPGRASPRVTRSAQPPPPSESSRRGAPKWLLAPGRREGSRGGGGRPPPGHRFHPPHSRKYWGQEFHLEVTQVPVSAGCRGSPTLGEGRSPPWRPLHGSATQHSAQPSRALPALPPFPGVVLARGAGERGCRWAVPHL